MEGCILSDEAVYSIKNTLQDEMSRGLDNETTFDSLPMKITFVTDRYKGTERGKFVSICAHSHHFTITLVNLRPNASPEISKKDYFIDPEIFKKPHIKIYEAFTECVKEFFIQHHLDGEIIPGSFCTDIDMKQYSLDTAVIPYFFCNSEMHPSHRDVKASFERVLQKDDYQAETDLVKTSKILDATSNISDSSDTERLYSMSYDVQLLGIENVRGLDTTLSICHHLLDKFKNLTYEGAVQKLLLDVSHAGIKVRDKVFKNILYYHPIHKISHIVLDFQNNNVFGYLHGDFLKGHQFFGFKADINAVEVVSLLRDIFIVELIRKKKEKLEMQASQVLIALKSFLSLVYELKSREIEIPCLLQKRLNMVENINCWLEGSFDVSDTVFEDPKEVLLHVQLQDLFAAACQLKQMEIEKEEAAKLEEAKLQGKHLRRKKKVQASKTSDASREQEPPDPLLMKVKDIFYENINYLKTMLKNSEDLLVTVNEILGTTNDEIIDKDHENLSVLKELYLKIFNTWNQECTSSSDKIQLMISQESSEREKINYEVSSIYTGKKQNLRVTKKLFKVSLFEDIDFVVPKQQDKSKTNLLSKVLTCKDYFLNSLKVRREEIEDLNYFISGLHFRKSIGEAEDSKALHCGRRLLIKAMKMRLKEIENIENKLKKLENTEQKIVFVIPDAIQFIVDQLKFVYDKKQLNLKVVESLFSDISTNRNASEETVSMYYNILLQYKELIASTIEDLKLEITKMQEKEMEMQNITSTCFLLYSQTVKSRKKEFDSAISDLDLLDSVVADSYIDEDKEFVHHCQEEFLTAACVREKEIQTLQLQMKTADTELKTEDHHIVITLKDLFHAAIEMEKSECEKVIKSSLESASHGDMKVLPVVYSFKDLLEVFAQHVKKTNSSEISLNDAQINTSLREFLIMAFELKQNEIEIPVSILKKDLENILLELIQEVKKRHHTKQLKHKIHKQALKISKSWKEVFLLSLDIREKEMKKVVALKRKDIQEEEAVLKSLTNDMYESTTNEASCYVNIWKKVFSTAVGVKESEMQKINEILENPVVKQKEIICKPKIESTSVDEEDKGCFEQDDSKTLVKEESPSEEILKAINSCTQIYDIAISKGMAELEEMEHEIRPIFSIEYDKEKSDSVGDEVTIAIAKSSNIISEFLESIKVEISSIKTNLESLAHVEENIKSQAASIKTTCSHFLTLFLEMEENASKNTEMKINKLDEAFEKIIAEDSAKFRPFTDLTVDVMSDEEFSVPDAEQKEASKKDESMTQESVESENTKLTKEEIQSVLLKIDSELQTDKDEVQLQRRKEAMDLFESCKSQLELASEIRRKSLESITLEIEKLKLPDPKKQKPKEKVQKALNCVIATKEIFLCSLNFRQQEIKCFLTEMEKMKMTEDKEQIVVEYESSDIVGNCRQLFQAAVETRRKNIAMMENETLEIRKLNFSDDIAPDAKILMKSEIYGTCKDLILGSVDLKMKEIDDISSHVEILNNTELRIESQIKQLNPEKHKGAVTKLEKAKDAVAICKKLCSSAVERARKEVRDTDKELELLKGALESSESSLITATCKNLLISAVEKREMEISDLELKLLKMSESVQDIFTKLDSLDLTEVESEFVENFSSDVAVNEQNTLSDMEPPAFSEIKNIESEECASSESVDIEQICKLKIDMVAAFLEEYKETINLDILKMKEEITSLESDLDKMKVTVQKVEEEDSQVFSLYHNAFTPMIEMRREELKSFETEINVIQKVTKERVENPIVKISEENQEESEVFLAVASCKKILNLAIKNRKNEKDAVDFELMKLVRFQDSRLTNLCKQLLLASLQKAFEEMEIIKAAILKMESISSENEMEILDVSLESLKNLYEATTNQIDALVSDMRFFSKKKIQMEIEESQFVLACKKLFSSQVITRLKEITVMNQELDNLLENQTFEEGFNAKLLNLKSVFDKICKNTISTRKKEIENVEFELIKHYDIKISEKISVCKKHLQTSLQDYKESLKQYESEAKNISDVAFNENKNMAMLKLKSLYSEDFKKIKKTYKMVEDIVASLQGRKINIDNGEKCDVKALLNRDACFEKLKTHAFTVINACKETLFSIIEVLETEIQNVNLMAAELKREENYESLPEKKQTNAFEDENSTFTEKELALLESLEKNILQSKSTKSIQVTEFCDSFFATSLYSNETLIQSIRKLLLLLSDTEESLLFEASKLVYFMIHCMKSIYDEHINEKNIIQNKILTLKDIKIKEKELDFFEDMLTDASAFKKEVIAVLNISLDSLENKEQCLNKEVSKACKNCGDIFFQIIEMLERNVEHISKQLESLKQFGIPDDEEESNLSEDEKAIKKCKLFLLAALDSRRKLKHSVNLELKFLKGGDVKVKVKMSTIFPSWHDRFLTFLDFQNDKEKKAIIPSVLNSAYEKPQESTLCHVEDKLESQLQNLANLKDLLKSLEQKSNKQPIYVISTWDDLFLQSFLKDQIDKCNLETNGKQCSNYLDDIMKERSWEELFTEANELMKKEMEISKKLKEKKHLIIPMPSWNEVFMKAVCEWECIMNKEAEQLKYEHLLLQWRKRMKSEDNLAYSRGCQYGFQPTNFEEFAKQFETRTKEYENEICDNQDLNLRTTFLPCVGTEKNQDGFESEMADNMSNKESYSWPVIFSKCVNLIEDNDKAFNCMKEKNERLQLQVLNISSSWDELFFEAIKKQKSDVQDEINESNALKYLAKVVNEEVQGTFKEPFPKFKTQKFDDWLNLIYDTSKIHESELLDALWVKKNEIEQSTKKTAPSEVESADNNFLSTDPEALLDQARRLMNYALKLRRKEVKKMEKELKSVEDLTLNKKSNFQILKSVLIWKLIVSVALNFKASGQRFEHEIRKYSGMSNEDLFAAALKSKMKEVEDFECYWKKFAEKQFFLEVKPNSVSWNEILDSVAELAKKDLAKMSMFGIKSEPSEEKQLDSLMKTDENLDISQEELADSTCWVDLILEILEQENNKHNSSSSGATMVHISDREEPLILWDEIFFYLNQMNKKVVQQQIFSPKKMTDFSKLKEIKLMTSSNFFSWDNLIIGVIEEILWTVNESSKNLSDILDAKCNSALFSTDVSNYFINSSQSNASLKELLKKLEVKSFVEILPCASGVKKIEIEDILNESKNKLVFPALSSQPIEFSHETIWKLLFPIAVEVWRKKMKNYLNFESSQYKKNCNVENSQEKELSTDFSGDRSSPNSECYENDLNSLQDLEKLVAYEHVLDVEEKISEKFSHLSELQNQLQSSGSKFSSVLKDGMRKKFRNGEKLLPKYFSISASWHEILKAALEQYKQFLNKAINLKECEEESFKSSAKPDATGKKLKFIAANILTQEITMQDLFDVVDSLKKKNLITLKDIKNADGQDATTLTSENLEVSKIIESFTEFFWNAFKCRQHEKSILRKEIEKLTTLTINNCEKYRVCPVLSVLTQYLQLAMETRHNENEMIDIKLESLHEFKSIFAGYLECPVTESLAKRNSKRLKEINSLFLSIERQQKTVMLNLRNHFDVLMSTLNSYLNRRKAQVQLVNFDRSEELGNNLELEENSASLKHLRVYSCKQEKNYLELFSNAKKICKNIMDLRKSEIFDLDQLLFGWKFSKLDESLENKIHIIISSILMFFENEISERKNATDIILQEVNNLKKKRSDLESKVSSAFENCKNFLHSAIENRKAEISSLKFGLNSVKYNIEKPNKKTLEFLNSCEGICNKFIRQRETEIEALEEHIVQLNKAKISQVQAVCVEYFTESIVYRKSELAVLVDNIESFQTLDEDVGNELSEAIEEALSDVIDFSSGRTFFHGLSGQTKKQTEIIDKEVMRKCSEFFVERRESVNTEIKAMEEVAELLKFFKGYFALEIMNIIDEFEIVLNNGLNAIKSDTDNIFSEQIFVKDYQNQFFSEVLEHLLESRKHFERNISEIEQDMYILKLQISILSEEYKEMCERDIIDSDTGSDFLFDKNKMDEIESLSYKKEDAEIVYSEESSVVRKSFDMLNSAIEFREKYSSLLSNEIKSWNDAEKKAFKILTECTDCILNMIECRKKEKEKIENILLPIQTCETGIIHTCAECLKCLLNYNEECLTAVISDFERLRCTMLNMEKKRSKIFDFCKQNLQYTSNLISAQMETMHSELMTMERMRTADDSDYVTASKLILQKGTEIRSNEVIVWENALEMIESEIEILPVVDLCRQQFQLFVKNRKEEITSAEQQIEELENEAPMLLLMHAPALQAVIDEDENVLVNLIPVIQTLNSISRQLKSEEGKIISACHNLYYSMLETLKIEKEAIKYDLDSLQKVELERKDIIDTEGKEITVSFKDLYLTAFKVKKLDLEKDIRKKNIEENIKMKRIEIIEKLRQKKSSNIEKETGKDPVDEFSKFVEYYDIKKEMRKLMIEKEIMDEFETIEKTFLTESSESFEMAKYSEESIEEETEIKSKTEESFNRVYEVRMKQVEEDITQKHKKITGVINKRKRLMENIVAAKREELEKNVTMKEREMKEAINVIKGKDSSVTCSLQDLFSEILHLKEQSTNFPVFENAIEKYVPKKFENFHVSVKLEKFIDIVLEIKETELQIMLQSKYKDIDKIISMARREIDRLVLDSKEKLEEALKQFRRSEKAKAMEYAVSGGSISQKDGYVIHEYEIFPDVNLFEQYLDSFKGFFVLQSKKACVYKDKTFRSEEIRKNDPTHISFCERHISMTDYVPKHILKLLDVEINHLTKILSDLNLDKAKAILHGLSFLSTETIAHDMSVNRIQRGIFLEVVSVLNDNTSMLVLGSFNDENCDISLNLDKDCSLVYFERAENIKKWTPVFDSPIEIAVDMGLKYFGRNGCLDEIATKFDWAVTTVPVGPSIFERFVSDVGLLEQIKFAFLELHHRHLFCRNCDFRNLFQDFGLSFDHILKILNSAYESELSQLLPLSSGIPSADDVIVANYVCRIILMRGALLTAICLSNVLERLKKKDVTVITTSFFIRESVVYQRMLKIFLSYLCPGRQVNFIYCNKSDCGVGASIMASVASQINCEMPHLYLVDLEHRLKSKNKLFSIQTFFKLLSNPELSEEAEHLAECYMKEIKFDLPLAVVWAYYFINGEKEKAENIYKNYRLSLAKVSHLVCRKISLTKNLDFARLYVEFLKKYDAEQKVKESAYKLLLDMLFYKEMYQEAVDLVQECIDNNIPLTKLRYSTLSVLHDFCARESSKKNRIPPFSLPAMDFDTSSSDSDNTEENEKQTLS